MGVNSALLWQKAYDALDSKNRAVVPSDFATNPEKLKDEVEKYVSQSQGKPIRLPNGETFFVRDVLQKISRWIKKFVEVGDTAAQYDPGHAALPWALLRLLLQASMNNIEKHAVVLEGIEKIAYYVAWGRIEESFLAIPFEAHAQLQLDFIQLYTTVLIFVARSIRFLHSKPQRIATAFFSSDSKFQKDMEQMATKKQSIESHVQQIMDQSSLKQWDEVKGRLADLHQPLVRIEDMFQSTLAMMDRVETDCILDWASEIPFEKHFKTVQKKALDGTGGWLFQDPEFIAWESCSRSQILWLHGSAGSGKSTLMSMVVQSLTRAHEEHQGPHPIYFFCSRNTAEPERADPEHILRSLMRQASDLPGGPPLHRNLKERYEKRRVKGSVSAEEAADILISTIESRPATYIVIDALDECDRHKREALLDALKTILMNSNSLVKIFVTSRDNHYDIASSMGGYPALCIDASRNQKDIDYYVQYSVQRAIDKKKLLPTERINDDLQQAIVKSLCNGADGMFRWVELQLELLYTIRVRSILLKRLERLPPKLEEIYSDLYHYKMQELGEEQAKVVTKILSWLLVAKAPLRTSEILQLICTSEEEEADMSIETVLDMTFDLVRVDPEQDQLKFSHLSVREFLENRQAEYEQIALQTMATCTCLRLLARVENIDARSYAALYWPFHAEDATKEGGSAKLQQQLDKFISKHNSSFKIWNNMMLQVLRPKAHEELSPVEQRVSQALAKSCNSLLTAACFGLPTILQRMLSETDHLDRINLRNCMGESALQLVSQYGSVASAQALVAKGASINAQGGKHGNALCAASFKGNVEIVRLLLDNGADVNVIGVTFEMDYDRCTSTALYAAASQGHADIVELLLRKGANVNSQVTVFTEDGEKCTSVALHAASSQGHEETVKLLLLGKDVNVNAKGGEGGNALCAALYRGHTRVAKLLLQKGADINAEGSSGDSALALAIDGGHLETARLLLERGAEVSGLDSALHSALSQGHTEIVKLLLHEGVNVNAREGNYGRDALPTTIDQGSLEFVSLLLDKGPNVNGPGSYNGKLLCHAISQGSLELVNLLLEKGADVDAQDGNHRNALCTASSKGSLEIMSLLLDKGADINAQGCNLGNALQAASCVGQLGIVKLLTDRDADVNAKGGKYGTALQAASFRGHLDIVRLLLENGANVNALGVLPERYQYHYGFDEGAYTFHKIGDYDRYKTTSTAVYAAASEGHIDVVKLLLDNNADVNPEADAFREKKWNTGEKLTDTALHAASSRGWAEIVKLLLHKGADVNAPAGFPDDDSSQFKPALDITTRGRGDNEMSQYVRGSALQAASLGGHLEVTKILLDAGANVNTQAGGPSDALQVASSNGHVEVVKLLLDQGASTGDALQTASSNGHVEIVKLLLDQGASTGDALRTASSNGHVEIVRLLLDQGTDISNALQGALARGHSDIVTLLLEKGANVNAKGDLGYSALHAACASNTEWPDVVEMLLHAGADVNTHGDMHDLPLQLASARGHEKIVRLLLDAGADVNAPLHEEHEFQDAGGDDEADALCAAAYEGHWEVVKMLLDAGATGISRESGNYSEALVAASSGGAIEVVRLLLDMGADVNSQQGMPLHYALFEGHREVAKLLVDKGVDVNAQGGGYGNALQAACASCSEQPEIVEMLLAAGADINAQGGWYGNALQAACASSASSEKAELVKLLLDAGADVNAQGRLYGNALQAACASYRVQPEIVEMLLTAGADINAQGGEYGNALQAACTSYRVQPEIVEMLLTAGADINAQGGEYGNALQAACASSEKAKLVKLLLDAGADVNAQGGLYGNALQAACASSREVAMVKLPINAGAEVNAQGGLYGTALQALCASSGEAEMVKLLLDAGADVNAQGGEHGNALYAACLFRDQPRVVELLLDAGADVNTQDGQYGNVLDAALSHGHSKVAKLLQRAGAQRLEQQALLDHVVP